MPPQTKAGDVVIRVSDAAPAVYDVGRVLNDGDQFGTDSVQVTSKKQALQKASELLCSDCQCYQISGPDDWIQEYPAQVDRGQS